MLKTINLTFSYPKADDLFRSLDLKFPRSGLVHIAGNNGSGKTTLLRLLSGLILPKEGTIRFNEEELKRGNTSYLSSNESAFFNQMTGQEGYELFLKLNKVESPPKALSLLNEIPLLKKARGCQFHQMSSGMKRVFLLTLCFTKDVNLFLLDEPFVGMDKETKESVGSVINELSSNSLIIYSSHETNSTLKPIETINLNTLKSKLNV